MLYYDAVNSSANTFLAAAAAAADDDYDDEAGRFAALIKHLLRSSISSCSTKKCTIIVELFK